MNNTNFVSIVPQTFEERVAMYMKCTKEELAMMMAENAKIINPDGCAEIVEKRDNSEWTTTTASTASVEWVYDHTN